MKSKHYLKRSLIGQYLEQKLYFLKDHVHWRGVLGFNKLIAGKVNAYLDKGG